jgi:hypothetical protein
MSKKNKKNKKNQARTLSTALAVAVDALAGQAVVVVGGDVAVTTAARWWRGRVTDYSEVAVIVTGS